MRFKLRSIFCLHMSEAPAPFVEGASLLPLNCFCVFTRNWSGISMWISLLALYSVPSISVSFSPLHHIVLIPVATESSRLFSSLGPVPFHRRLKISLSRPTENLAGTFRRIALKHTNILLYFFTRDIMSILPIITNPFLMATCYFKIESPSFHNHFSNNGHFWLFSVTNNVNKTTKNILQKKKIPWTWGLFP